MSDVRRAGIAFVALCAACTQGPGRDPLLLDGSVKKDADPTDVGFFDSGDRRDAGPEDVPISVIDSGVLPDVPFTGVFGILNSGDFLYAREVDGKLHLIVDDFPYSYVGTISADGVVDTQSPQLLRSGCLVPTISGTYDRQGAVFNLQHRTCNAQNDALSSSMSGGFVDNFAPQFSGVYSVVARVVDDQQLCYDAPGPTIPATWALSVLPNNRAFFFAPDDLVDGYATAFGLVQGTGVVMLTQRTSAGGAGQSFVLTGELTRLTVSDPWMLRVDRGVWDPAQDCAFTIEASGPRIDFP